MCALRELAELHGDGVLQRSIGRSGLGGRRGYLRHGGGVRSLPFGALCRSLLVECVGLGAGSSVASVGSSVDVGKGKLTRNLVGVSTDPVGASRRTARRRAACLLATAAGRDARLGAGLALPGTHPGVFNAFAPKKLKMLNTRETKAKRRIAEARPFDRNSRKKI